MADFYAPQFNPPPDVLGSYIRGQMAPGAVQEQQNTLASQGLSLDQMRLAMQSQQMKQQAAQQYVNAGQTQGAGAPGGGTGGVQNGPQTPQSSGNPLSDFMSAQQLKLAQGLDVLEGRDPLATAQKAQDMALNIKKMQLQGPMNLAQQVATDPQANIMVSKNPQLLQGFKQWAAARGMNPDDPSVLTLSNAQAAARAYYNNLQGQIGQSGGLGFSGTLKPGEAAYQNGQVVAGSLDAMTPYQQQELKIRQQELAARGADQRKPQLVDVPMPDGTTQKQWIVPGHDQGLNVGAPEAAKPGQGMGRVQQMVGRLTLAGNEVAQSAENLMKLGINTDSGWFGLASPQHGGILTSMKNALTNVVSAQDTKSYGIMVSGVKRNLAAIEAAGNMPPGSLTAQMDQVELKPGDTQLNKLQRMAEIRQISQAGLESILTQPGLSKQQLEQINGINARLAKAIPFTQADILNLQQSKNPHMTITDMAKSTGVQAQADSAHPPEVQSLLDKYK